MSHRKTPDAAWAKVSRQHSASVAASYALELRRAEAAFREDHADDVVFQVNEGEDLRNVAWEKQADAAMHTLDAWEKRFALRRDPQVREVLHTGWWMTALRTLQAQAPDSDFTIMDKASYVRIYKLLFRALAGFSKEKYDASEAEQCADEDWASDSRDGVSMPRELFMDSLFQIADLYTESATASEYAMFLRKILLSCIVKGTDLASNNSVFWKSRPAKQKAVDSSSGMGDSSAGGVPPVPPPGAGDSDNGDSDADDTGRSEPADGKKKKGGKKKKKGDSSVSKPQSGTGSGMGGGESSRKKLDFVSEQRSKVFASSDVWVSAGSGSDLLGLQFARMDWREIEKLPPEKREQYNVWRNSQEERSLEDKRFEAMDWGAREVVKEEVCDICALACTPSHTEGADLPCLTRLLTHLLCAFSWRAGVCAQVAPAQRAAGKAEGAAGTQSDRQSAGKRAQDVRAEYLQSDKGGNGDDSESHAQESGRDGEGADVGSDDYDPSYYARPCAAPGAFATGQGRKPSRPKVVARGRGTTTGRKEALRRRA